MISLPFDSNYDCDNLGLDDHAGRRDDTYTFLANCQWPTMADTSAERLKSRKVKRRALTLATLFLRGTLATQLQ